MWAQAVVNTFSRITQPGWQTGARHRGKHGHGVLLGPKAPLDMYGRPGTFRFILRNAERVLAAMPQGATIEPARDRPNHIAHHQPHRPPEGALRASLARRDYSHS